MNEHGRCRRGWMIPVIMFTTVFLPAPFGPMRPVMRLRPNASRCGGSTRARRYAERRTSQLRGVMTFDSGPEWYRANLVKLLGTYLDRALRNLP